MALGLIILVTILATVCQSYKVLLVPMPATSHAYSFYYIAQELMARGHEVHFLFHYGYMVPVEWTEKNLNGAVLFFHKYGNASSPINLERQTSNVFMEVMFNSRDNHYVFNRIKGFTESFSKEFFYGNEEVMEHLESLKLDVAVIDNTFFMKFPVLFAKRLRLPLISYTDVIEPWLIRMPWLPSIYSPLILSTDNNNGFFQRLLNTLLLLKMELFPPFQDPDDEILDGFRKFEHFESLKDIVYNSVLFLTTDDPVLDPIRPCTANAISVGGLTTESLKNLSPLPNDYLNFIEECDGKNANSGSIAVSFGSLVSKYPEHLATVFLTAFGKLPQYKFIWRFENYLNFSIPNNVKIVKWLAQKELLSHPSVKLFITHSGNNGQFEAVYFGVPMLAIPLLGDQPKNAKRIVEKGYGEELDFRNLEVDQLVRTIKKVINIPSYKKKIVKASKIFKSRRDTPAQRAAFWIEHVIQFGGDHLKPAGNDLKLWQYLCLDVLLFIQMFTAVMTILLIFVLRAILKSSFCMYPLLATVQIGETSNTKKNK